MKAAAGNTFPKIEQQPNKPWITQETLGLTQQAKAARDLDQWHLERQLEKDIKKQARKDRTNGYTTPYETPRTQNTSYTMLQENDSGTT